jgi:hypothetical protein
MKSSRGTVPALLGLLLGLCLWLPGGKAEAAEDWEWTFVPYFWLADMGADVTIDDTPVLEIDIRATDLIDKVEIAFQGHLEGRRGRGGFFMDLTYMEIADSLTLPDGPSIDADMTQALIEGGGFYRLQGESSGLDVLFGVRVFEIDQELVITADRGQATIDDTATFTDGFVGLRYAGSLGEKWSFRVRGDVGAGDSELALNGVVAFGYEVGKSGKYSLHFGWRVLDYEIEAEDEGAKVETDLTMSGPALGFQIKF